MTKPHFGLLGNSFIVSYRTQTLSTETGRGETELSLRDLLELSDQLGDEAARPPIWEPFSGPPTKSQ